MQIFIRGFEEIEVVELGELKKLFLCRRRIGITGIILSNDTTILENDIPIQSLFSYEFDLTFPLLGGKVHVSLARASQVVVKGQTPKVEKTEKKKKKTGRAKKREQYNRRFVNVVQSFGRQPGPNSNSS